MAEGARRRQLPTPGVAVFASLAIVSFCLMLDAPTAHAVGGSYKVTSSGDQPDAHPGDGSCSSTALLGLCTLRAAPTEANMDNGPSSISFLITARPLTTRSLATGSAPTPAGTANQSSDEPGVSDPPRPESGGKPRRPSLQRRKDSNG
jgi:hypothetical protein